MKSIILLLTAILMQAHDVLAQNQVILNIHHKLGTEDFTLNMPAKNNMDHDFMVTRLEYYISGISVIHDNGTSTLIDSLWILVNATRPTQVNLGNYPINQVEGIHFYIGVDSAHNHLDPASYDPFHPLAPKNPSMHWGWASGYRFMAFEGNGGSNYDQLIQLHGLGDQNYIKTKLLVDATADNGQVEINLNADYIKVLEDISVNSGIIVHGENLQAQQALENFRYFVFSPSEEPTGIAALNPLERFDVYPNPAFNGQSAVCVEMDGGHVLEMIITDVAGRQIGYYDQITPGIPLYLTLSKPGIYFVYILADRQPAGIKKLVSN